MKLEKLPQIDLEVNSLDQRVTKYVVALFLASNLDQAIVLMDALKEVLAVIENAIYRARREAR